MKQKAAIIDPLGAHGSSHHFYLFGQLKGLKSNKVDVTLYTNSVTDNPCIDGVGFYQFFGDLFASKFIFVRGLKYIFGIVRSVFHARFAGVKVFHFHIFYTNILVLVNIFLVKLLFGKVVLTIHDVASFASNKKHSFIGSLIYKSANLILTHNGFSK